MHPYVSIQSKQAEFPGHAPSQQLLAHKTLTRFSQSHSAEQEFTGGGHESAVLLGFARKKILAIKEIMQIHRTT